MHLKEHYKVHKRGSPKRDGERSFSQTKNFSNRQQEGPPRNTGGERNRLH